MAVTAGSGGVSGAILAILAATAVAGTITTAVITAGAQDQLEQKQCSAPGENLVSQELPTGSGGGSAGGTIDGIPPDYMELYSSAASEYGIDTAVLAAVGYIETGHGSNKNTSSAGAQGSMQFMPDTFATVGYDANGDGTADIMDPEDAIPSAAKLLRDSGAPEDYHGALFAYNNSEAYVADVLAKADEYRASMGGDGDLALIPAAFPSAEDTAESVGALSSFVGDSLGMRPAYAVDQGWDLVDDNLNLQYEDYSSWGGEVQQADESWSALGTVNVEPSPDSSETDVQIGDGALPEGIAGRTYSDGRILLDIDGPHPETAVTHEFGHAVRLGHDVSGTVMDEDPYTHPSAPTPADEAAYYAIWGEGDGADDATSEGTPVSNSEPDDGGGEAVLPLPQTDENSFKNEWSTNEGTDFGASEGTPVSSVVGGKVIQNEGSQNSVMIQADYSVGTIQKGDMVFLDGVGKKGVSIGDQVSAGQQIGEVGSDGLHLGLYDPTGERAESGSGAYDSYSMMNWVTDQDGGASGTAVEGPACETPQSAGGSPSGGGTSGGSGGSGGTTPGSANAVIAEAEKYMGVPYLLGGPEVCVPGETMDCTCLTTTVYREFGYELPDHPQIQLDYGEPVDSPEPGDLVIFPDPGDGSGGHVGIAIGNGEMIHACLPCGETTTGPISGAGTPNGYRRLVG